MRANTTRSMLLMTLLVLLLSKDLQALQGPSSSQNKLTPFGDDDYCIILLRSVF